MSREEENRDEPQNHKFNKGDIIRRWFFFYEGEEDGWTFEVKAKNPETALQVAYDNHGPQVCSMYFREMHPKKRTENNDRST